MDNMGELQAGNPNCGELPIARAALLPQLCDNALFLELCERTVQCAGKPRCNQSVWRLWERSVRNELLNCVGHIGALGQTPNVATPGLGNCPCAQLLLEVVEVSGGEIRDSHRVADPGCADRLRRNTAPGFANHAGAVHGHC